MEITTKILDKAKKKPLLSYTHFLLDDTCWACYWNNCKTIEKATFYFWVRNSRNPKDDGVFSASCKKHKEFIYSTWNSFEIHELSEKDVFYIRHISTEK